MPSYQTTPTLFFSPSPFLSSCCTYPLPKERLAVPCHDIALCACIYCMLYCFVHISNPDVSQTPQTIQFLIHTLLSSFPSPLLPFLLIHIRDLLRTLRLPLLLQRLCEVSFSPQLQLHHPLTQPFTLCNEALDRACLAIGLILYTPRQLWL